MLKQFKLHEQAGIGGDEWGDLAAFKRQNGGMYDTASQGIARRVNQIRRKLFHMSNLSISVGRRQLDKMVVVQLLRLKQGITGDEAMRRIVRWPLSRHLSSIAYYCHDAEIVTMLAKMLSPQEGNVYEVYFICADCAFCSPRHGGRCNHRNAE
jgi:hypothetical protein